MAKYCRSNFPEMMDSPDVLPTILKNNFHPSRQLYNDILSPNSNFNEFIYSQYELMFPPPQSPIANDNSQLPPTELLKKYGYTLHHCETVADVEKFEHYYNEDNRLCTFDDIQGRLSRKHIYWLVREDVDTVQPDNPPTREGKFSTSLLCLQFNKGANNGVQIISRCNHTLSHNPDVNERNKNPNATFRNNLDTFIPGLKKSFEDHFGYNICNATEGRELSLHNYWQASDGKFYKYNSFYDDVAFCPDNIIIDNGVATQLDKGRYEVLDSCILDKKEKNLLCHLLYKKVIKMD